MVFSVNTIKESLDKELPKYDNTTDEEVNFLSDLLSMQLAESLEFENMITKEELLSEVSLINFKLDTDALKYIGDKISKFDITSIFSRIFDFFVEAIERLVKAFGSFLLNFVNKDAQLAGFKDKIFKFRGSIRYTKPYYDYRNLDMDTSKTTYQIEMEKEYRGLIDNLITLGSCKDNTTLLQTMQEIKRETENIQSDMDSLRGRVVSQSSISEEDFEEALFEYFRGARHDERVSMFSKNIDSARIQQAYKDYYKAKEQRHIVQRDSSKLKIEAAKQKAAIRTINLNKYISVNYINDSQIIMLYNHIVNNKCRRVKAICDIYSQLFAAKLTALADYNRTNKEILLLVCKEITREGE
jgi:hypothetical protein